MRKNKHALHYAVMLAPIYANKRQLNQLAGKASLKGAIQRNKKRYNLAN